MVLPNNGKVVIIDDQPKEVEELMMALTKEKMPFLFFTDRDGSDLPEDGPVENIRLVFLDLDLGIGGTDPLEKIRIIQSRLTRILTPNTPYVLVLWSRHEDRYADTLFGEFEGDFKDYRPINWCSLEKAEIKSRKEVGESVIEHVRARLKEKLSEYKSFNAFLIWEAIVNASSGRLTNEVLSLYEPDENWDKKTKYLLYKLAFAYSGKAVVDFTDIAQLKNALYTLTLTCSDNIESSINATINENFSGLISMDAQDIPNFSCVMNKLLLISESIDSGKQPGNIFFSTAELEDEIKHSNEIFENRKKGIENLSTDKQELALDGIKKKYLGQREELSKQISKKNSESHDIIVSSLENSIQRSKEQRDEILKHICPVELNITPLCDYAQEKAKTFRILPGVMLNKKYRQYLSKTHAYTYISDANFRLKNNDCFFLFDFRYLYSVSAEEISNRKAKYRLKQQLLSDIQVKLGSHINRAGVNYID